MQNITNQLKVMFSYSSSTQNKVDKGWKNVIQGPRSQLETCLNQWIDLVNTPKLILPFLLLILFFITMSHVYGQPTLDRVRGGLAPFEETPIRPPSNIGPYQYGINLVLELSAARYFGLSEAQRSNAQRLFNDLNRAGEITASSEGYVLFNVYNPQVISLLQTFGVLVDANPATGVAQITYEAPQLDLSLYVSEVIVGPNAVFAVAPSIGQPGVDRATVTDAFNVGMEVLTDQLSNVDRQGRLSFSDFLAQNNELAGYIKNGIIRGLPIPDGTVKLTRLTINGRPQERLYVHGNLLLAPYLIEPDFMNARDYSAQAGVNHGRDRFYVLTRPSAGALAAGYDGFSDVTKHILYGEGGAPNTSRNVFIDLMDALENSIRGFFKQVTGSGKGKQANRVTSKSSSPSTTSITDVNGNQVTYRLDNRQTIYPISDFDISQITYSEENPIGISSPSFIFNEFNSAEFPTFPGAFTFNEDVANQLGGVDFTGLEIVGYEFGGAENPLKFIYKASTGGSNPIDVANEIAFKEKIFKQALAIPEADKHISLNWVIDENGQTVGEAGVPDVFSQTDIARYMFEADEALKLDYLNALRLEFGISERWKTLIESSPFIDELRSKNFNAFPRTRLRGTILPVVGESNYADNGNRLLVEQAELQIKGQVIAITADLSSYELSLAAYQDVQSRIDVLRAEIQQALDSKAIELIPIMNDINHPSYGKLKEILPILVAAKLYKAIENTQKPFQEIIDSNNLTGFATEIPFDRPYWDSRAYRFLGGISFIDFYGIQRTTRINGGATLRTLRFDDYDLGFSTEQINLLNQLDTTPVVQQGNEYFFTSTEETINIPEFTVGIIEILNAPYLEGDEYIDGYFLTDASVDFQVDFINSGNVDGRSYVNVYARLLNGPQTGRTFPIAQRFINLDKASTTQQRYSFTPFIKGRYQIVAEINNEPAYREIEFSLTNQQNYTSFVALANIPSFSFTLPVNNVFFGQEVNLGASVSYDTGDELTYTIQSDIDGQLLNHTTTETYLDTTRQLSYGRHELTYTIRDREGRIDTRTQIIDVVAGSDSFLVSINSLLDGETIPRNTDFTLGLDVVSPELGSICPSQGLNQNVLISWESSADGTIGEANTCESIASLSSLGVHTLTAKVNIGGQLVEKSVTVNVVESTLSATITSPTSGTSQGSSDVWNFTGIGTALSTVPLSNDSLTWYSNQDGYLGAGPSITAFLSAGTHEITLRVKNTLGEANTDKITVACNDDNAIPQMSILHPINNFGFEGGTDFRSYIAGIDLATANIEWSSSIDGVLGTAPNLPMTMLSPGAHTITLKVEGDFASIPLSQSVGINISRPVPEVAISMSDANTGTLLGATISETQDIQLTAIPQNGANLADATYEWRLRYYGSLSSVATLLGNGVSITSGNLSPGNYELLLIATTPENRKDTVSRDVLVMNEQTIIINTFNDGNSSNRSYTGPATYTPSLTVPADVTVLEASATFTTGTISTSGFVFKANGQTKISISGELASNTTYSVSFSVSSLQVPGSSTVIPFEITVGSGMIDGNIYVGYAAGINGSEDVTLPIINNLQVSPHPVVENNSTIVSATITDNAGLSSIYYKEENSGFNLINLNGETSYTLSETLTPAGLGKRALTVIATDVNGLSSVEEIPVSVVKNGTDIDIIGDDSFTFFVEEQSQTTVRKVRNIGNTMVANLPVAFYVNNQEVERESVSLLPGEEITLSFDWTPLVSGPITTKVMVDPENQLSELDETNNYSENILSVIDAIPPTITDLQYPEFVALSDSFNIRVVANDNASGDMFKLEGDYLGVSKDKTGLNQMFYELDFVVGNTGTNPVLLAISDFAGRKTVSVAEITTVAPNADLQITSFDYGTDIIAFTGLETRPLYVTISNNGSNGEDAGEFDVVFYQNGVEQDRVTVEELPVGDSRELDFEWQIALGEQFLEVIVDPLDNIQEMNENNNTASFRTLIEDDLPIIQNANITGQPVYIGGNFQIQATISDLVGLDEVLVAYQGIEQTMNLLDDSTGLYEANLTADTIGRQYVEIITTDTRGQVSKQKVYLTVYDVSVDLQVDHNNGIVAEYGDDLVAALSIRVGNFGGTAANNVLVSVLHNGVEIGNSTIDLAKGSIEELSFSANFVEGNNNIEVVLDPDSIIDESNEANNSSIRTFYVNDTFAPETPLLSISPDGWSTSSLFSVSWPADADPSVSYAYRLGSGDYVNVGNTTTVSIDVEEEGVHFLDVIAIDSLGNQSVPADTVLLYDAAEPNAPILTEMACGEEWTNLCDSAFIVWNIPELLSDPMGVATYRIVVDGISQQVEGNVNTMWLNQLGEGMHSIYVVAIDELGRESAPSNLVNIKVDRSGPAELLVTSSTHPSETEWYNSNSPVAMSWTPTVTDLSGIHQYFYVFNTEEDFNFIPEALTPAPASETSVDLTTTYIVDSLLTPIPEGEYYFHIVASDSAGNIGIPNKYRFGIDLTWPMTSIHYQGIEASDGLTITTGIPLQIVADDYLSGVQDSYYSVNGGMYLSGSQITLAQPGSYAITYYSVDSAGNQEPVDTINVTVSEALPCIGNILFITDINNNTGLPSSGGDRDLKEIIENTGLNVILIDDQSFTLADAQDKDLVFISSNTYSGYLTDDDLANLPIPIVNTEFVLFDDLGLSDGSHDHVSGKTVSVTNENHPITDGLPADVFVYNNVGPLAFNVPSNPDHVILSVPGHPEKGVITAFEVGDSLENGTVAPARRVTLFARNLVEGNLTEDGERIIGNAVIWAMNSCIPSPTTTSVISGNVCSTSGEIVYVMDNGNPNQGDTELINRITNLGHSVTVIDDDVFDYTDAAGKELVVISSSVISSKLADEHLHTMNVPVIVWESYSFDDLKLSDQYGNIENQDKIAISSGNHPIISGLAHGQPITVYNNEADMAYIETQSIPSENVLATVQGMPEKAVITAFDAGDTLSDGSVALARRVSLFNRDYKAGKLTTYGAVIFDNAISWAMSDCSENNTRIAQPVSENSPIKTNAYPNPFSNSVNVSFSLEKDATISIKLYDITGKQVNELLPSQKEVEGKHNYSFEMGGLRNGVYILTIECDNEVFYIEKLIKG